jgi:outer membrane protein TolC
MNAADKSIASTQVTVEQGEENFKISEVRYSAGVGTNVDVIDAEVALTQAKNNYIQALYNYNTARANLDQAIGKTVVSNQ